MTQLKKNSFPLWFLTDRLSSKNKKNLQQPSLALKREGEKEEQAKPKSQQKEGDNKDQRVNWKVLSECFLMPDTLEITGLWFQALLAPEGS